jgi:hypothetical protein
VPPGQKWSINFSNAVQTYLSKFTVSIKIGRTVKKLETILVLEERIEER